MQVKSNPRAFGKRVRRGEGEPLGRVGFSTLTLYSMIPCFARESKWRERKEDQSSGAPLMKLRPVHSTWDVTTICEVALALARSPSPSPPSPLLSLALPWASFFEDVSASRCSLTFTGSCWVVQP
jgi:hypothetical protein